MDTAILLALVGLPVVILYLWYVSIISRRNKAQEALSGIDVQLKQRFNLIPNILQIAKKFMEHEQSLLTEITELRAKTDQEYDKSSKDAISQHLAVAGQLTGKMGQLMVAVEDYPDLKSDQTMIQAMRTYNEVEAQIAAARRFYNASVTSLHNAIQIFPGTLIADKTGVTEMPFYEADELSKSSINAADILN